MPLTNTPNRLNILKSGFEMPEHCGGDHWAILHGDSLQIVRQFEPHSFDAIITDPPYASGGANQNTKNRTTSVVTVPCRTLIFKIFMVAYLLNNCFFIKLTVWRAMTDTRFMKKTCIS